MTSRRTGWISLAFTALSALGLALFFGQSGPSEARAEQKALEKSTPAGKTSETSGKAGAKPPVGPTFPKDIAPFLAKHCYACHGNGKKEAGLTLDKYRDDESLLKDRKVWENVIHMIRTGEMPPDKRPRPKAEEIESALKSIDAVLARFDCNGPRPAGRVTLRRLNREEYDNTIRDLAQVDFQPGASFPADDVGYGFDNIGDVLTLSPLLLERYLTAAESVLERAIVNVDPPKAVANRLGGTRLIPETAGGNSRGGTFLHSKGSAYVESYLDEGDYIIRAEVFGQQLGDEPVKGSIRVGRNGPSQDFTTKAERNSPETIELKLRLKAGTARVSVAFNNPFTEPEKPAEKPDERKPDATDKKADKKDDKKPEEKKPAEKKAPDKKPEEKKSDDKKPADKKPDEKKRDDKKGPPGKGPQPPAAKQRQLFIRSIVVDGPYNPPPVEVPASHKKIMAHKEGLEPREAAREIVGRFATRAFRRPVAPAEVEKFLTLYDLAEKSGERFESRIRFALDRVLVSPHFLFRVELDPPAAEGGKNYPVNEYELASRLSYFLWTSMPDDELFALAEKGELRKNLDAQVRRMLADPKSQAFVENFAGQWLTLRSLANTTPDRGTFPQFDDELMNSMKRETELFFEAVVREDKSVLDFLDGNFSFVNERLAKHYGISGIRGKKFQRVTLPANRGGILTHASILTLTSNPTRTSPVKRGKWVLEQILNTPPPPPPPDVPALEEQKQLTGSLRQVLEQHRASPVCASCHERMDPIGFAFENYDAVGAWREKDGKFPIDPAGVLPGGEAFAGPAELKAVLRGKKDLFVRCLSEKMLTYALGRGLEYYDKCALDTIVAGLVKNDYKMSALIAEVVRSEPMQLRTATGKKP